jgi:hypothetical protein
LRFGDEERELDDDERELDDDPLRELAEERLRLDADPLLPEDRLLEERPPEERLPEPLLDALLLDDLLLDERPPEERLFPLDFDLPPEPPLLRRSAMLLFPPRVPLSCLTLYPFEEDYPTSNRAMTGAWSDNRRRRPPSAGSSRASGGSCRGASITRSPRTRM